MSSNLTSFVICLSFVDDVLKLVRVQLDTSEEVTFIDGGSIYEAFLSQRLFVDY